MPAVAVMCCRGRIVCTPFRRETVENKDIRITLLYNLDEVNVLLTLLGSLPFNQSAALIANIREQALPQLPLQEVATEQPATTN